MVRRIIHSEKGYTLVEIMVSLAVLSVVVSLVSVTFLFVSGRMAAWSDQISFYNDFQMVNDQLYNDLMRTESTVYTDTTLTVYLERGVSRHYAWKERKLTINGSTLLAPQDSVGIFISERQDGESNVIAYHFFLKKGAREMQDSAFIYVRKPTLWKSMKGEEL